ncbi:MAG: hypothetical protein LIP10_03665 [Clostridiales bacterium]|nr:hypothetical protein [Clostridiales bacterium]
MSTGAEVVIGVFTGAAVGAGTSILAMKKHFENEKQKEVEEIRNIYMKKAEEDGEPEKAEKIRKAGETVENKDADMKEYRKRVQSEGYVKYSGDNPGEKTNRTPMKKDWIPPYIISPEQFDEHADDGLGWETRTLLYFADGVLTDNDSNKIEDMSTILGDKEILTHFGEYEEDSIHVRNENRKIDYEVLLDQRTWKEVNAKKPKTKRLED